MKLIIAGSRTFTDYKKRCEVCDQFLQDQTDVEIISGAYYKGADKLGEKYAAENGFPIKQFPADWERYSRAAGPKRNKQMAKYGDALIALWNGKSNGTKNMIDLAKSKGLIIIIIYQINPK